MSAQAASTTPSTLPKLGKICADAEPSPAYPDPQVRTHHNPAQSRMPSFSPNIRARKAMPVVSAMMTTEMTAADSERPSIM